MLPLAALQLLQTFAVAAPRVAAAPLCPNAELLDVAIAKLAFPPGADAHAVSLTPEAGRLQLTLLDAEGNVLGSRQFEPSDSCADLASAIALVLLFWEAEPTAPELPAPVLPDAPGETTKVRSDVPDTEQPAPVLAKPAPFTPHLALALAPLASLAVQGSNPAAFGGTISGVLLNPARRLGVILSLTGNTTRRLSLPPGTVDWTRFSAAAGVVWQWHRPHFTATVEGELALGVVEAQANGFQTNDTVLALEGPGVALGARIAWAPALEGTFRLWAGLRALAWPVPVTLQITNPTLGVPLPWGEILFNLGLEQELF